MKRVVTTTDFRWCVLSARSMVFESFTRTVVRALVAIVRRTVPSVRRLRWSARAVLRETVSRPLSLQRSAHVTRTVKAPRRPDLAIVIRGRGAGELAPPPGAGVEDGPAGVGVTTGGGA